jgi:hypothetical protein
VSRVDERLGRGVAIRQANKKVSSRGRLPTWDLCAIRDSNPEPAD